MRKSGPGSFQSSWALHWANYRSLQVSTFCSFKRSCFGFCSKIGRRRDTSRDFHLHGPQPIVHDCPSSLLSCKNTKDRPGEGVAEERLSFPLSAASPLTSHRRKEINTRGETTKLQWLLMTDLVWVRIATLPSCRDWIRLGLIRQRKEKWQPLPLYLHLDTKCAHIRSFVSQFPAGKGHLSAHHCSDKTHKD